MKFSGVFSYAIMAGFMLKLLLMLMSMVKVFFFKLLLCWCYVFFFVLDVDIDVEGESVFFQTHGCAQKSRRRPLFRAGGLSPSS